MLLEGQTGGLGPSVGSISGCAEPFYGTMVGPWWYHTATSVPRVRNPPFSLLRMLMQVTRRADIPVCSRVRRLPARGGRCGAQGTARPTIPLHIGVHSYIQSNGVLAWGHSSVRSAMSIAQAVIGPSKLRQERHGEEDYLHNPGRALDPIHAAPDGAWMVFPCASSIDMALLSELSRCSIPPKTAKSPCCRGHACPRASRP